MNLFLLLNGPSRAELSPSGFMIADKIELIWDEYVAYTVLCFSCV
jgi:hypothetical protein